MLSGRVLFNDPLTTYVNNVANKLLDNNTQLRGKFNIHVYKSTSVNAFATNEGYIFVTLGLLARLENEAQLAFVLAHEMVHVQKKHSIERFVKVDKIERGKGAYRAKRVDEQMIEKCLFSKEQEKEADMEGLKIFLNSPYSTDSVLNIFEVLKFARLPIEDVTFEPSFFESEYLKFPNSYKLKQTQPINKEDDLNDERSTHPAVKLRREAIAAKIAGANNTGKQTFWVGRTNFEIVRETSRFELSRLFTLFHAYEEALYNSYVLLKKYPNNLFLKKNIAYCIAAMGVYENEDQFGKVHTAYDKIEGGQQQLYYLLGRIDSVNGDLKVVALAYVLKLLSEYPDDADLKNLYERILINNLKQKVRRYESFKNELSPPEKLVDTEKNAAPERSIAERYADEQFEKPKAVSRTENHFTNYALAPFMGEKLKTDFETAEKKLKEERLSQIADSEDEKQKNLGKYNLFALGQNDLVIVNPTYSRLDARRKEKFKMLESESGKIDFADRLLYNAKAAKLNAQLLDNKNIKVNEISKYNDLTLLNDYFIERISYPEEVFLPSYERMRIHQLADKYKTENFMWTGVVNYTDKNLAKRYMIAFGVLVPIYLPLMIPYYINVGKYTYYYTVLYNIRNDTVKMYNSRLINNSTKGYILDSQIYDLMQQIKAKQK